MKIIYILFTALCLMSCSKDTPLLEEIDIEYNDSEWMKINLPFSSESGVQAIYGSIDDTLIAATLFNIYLTTDKGISWKKVYQSNVGITGFKMNDGELSAFTASFGSEVAFDPSLFSYDNGETWSLNRQRPTNEFNSNIKHPRHIIHYNDQISYRIDDNLKPIVGSSSYSHGPNKLFRVAENTEEELYFPSKRYFNYLHLDKKNRLYVGATGITFEGIDEKFVLDPNANLAIIYISRRPIDEMPQKTI